MSVQYLKVAGTVTPDNRIDVRLGGLSAGVARIGEAADSPLVAEVFNSQGNLILRRRLPLVTSCTFPHTGVNLDFADRIPLSQDGVMIRFSRDGIPLTDLPVSHVAPQVNLTWSPSGTIEGIQSITWTGAHPEQRELSFIVRYSWDGGKRWQPISLRVADTELSVDINQLPGGEQCRIAVVASDGINTTISESAPFSVAIKPCQVSIQSPIDGAVFESGAIVTFRGQGFYLEENAPETEFLSWTSSQDGDIGRGMVFDSHSLSEGNHMITLRAGSELRAGEAASIQIVILATNQNA